MFRDYEEPIFDYNFGIGDKAQYVYIGPSGAECLATVKILDIKILPSSKTYITSIQEDIMKKANLEKNAFLDNHYATELDHQLHAIYLYPDELVPFTRQLSVVIDNTRS